MKNSGNGTKAYSDEELIRLLMAIAGVPLCTIEPLLRLYQENKFDDEAQRLLLLSSTSEPLARRLIRILAKRR